MGNGEQYIWKPPEDEEMLAHQNKALAPLGAHTVDSIQPSAAVVSNKTPLSLRTSFSLHSGHYSPPPPPIDGLESGASGWRSSVGP